MIEPDPEQRTFFVETLRRAGVETIVRDEISTMDVDDVDVVLAELDAAVTSNWFPRACETGKPRVALTSRIASLLSHWREQGIPTIRLPASTQSIVAVVTGKAQCAPTSAFIDSVEPKPARRLTQDVVADLGYLTDLVAAAARTPLALVTVIEGDRQQFLLQTGFDDDLMIAGGTPSSWSFCRHVAESDAPLVVSDARQHPVLASSPLVRMGLVQSYAGLPIRSNGAVVGIVCALAPEPRRFLQADLATLRLAAELVEARLRTLSAVSTPSPSDEAPPETMLAKVSSTKRETAPDRDELIGEVLGERYVVTAALGSGGMSHVYLARETTLGTLVAIKVLHRGEADQALIDEARTIANVRHSNIVQAMNWGRTKHGAFFLVLEYVRGQSLHHLVRERRAQGQWTPTPELVSSVRDVAAALESLHAVGIVHGDVKPLNVLSDASLDRRVLIDFGLAMRMEHGGPTSSGTWRVGATARVGGTPGFSAPEQFVAEPALVPAPQLDVYGLAALAYYLLVGRAPFADGGDQGLVGARAAVFTPPSKVRSDIPGTLDQLFTRSLSADPKERPPSPTSFVDLFERALSGEELFSAAPLGVPSTRGESLVDLRNVVRELLGSDGERAIAGTMPGVTRSILEEAGEPDRWIPATVYLDYLRSYSQRAPLENLGAAAYRTLGLKQLVSMKIARSPHTLVRTIQAGFHRNHDWCRFEFTPIDTHAVTVKLSIPPELGAGNFLCTLIAGWTRSMLQAVRREVTITHARCIATHDEYCELHCAWKD